IYTHCSFQDLTAQRTKRIIETLRFLEGRINAMMDIWGASLDDDADPGENGREATRHQDLGSKLDVFHGLDQTEIDDVIVEGDVVTVLEPELEMSRPGFEPVADDVAWDGDEAESAQAESAERGSAEVAMDAAEAFAIEDALEVVDPLGADPLARALEPAELALEPVADDAAEDEVAEDEVADAPSFSAEAFAEIDGLGTREKLARFS
ncbi:hypothetical protein ACTZWW_15765, partial [Salinarimonas sp. NSM]